MSQARTEAALLEHLASRGVTVERRTALVDLRDGPDGVTCRLQGGDGSVTTVRARYVVGCDGAHSTVRTRSGIPFLGGRYAQTFLLADLAVDGLEPGAVHAYLTPAGPLLFFPLEEPAPWRLIAMRPTGSGPGAVTADDGEPTAARPVALDELQARCRAATSEPLTLHEPVWATGFRIHHRLAASYRVGRTFLAGDAAHIHSPAGAQGMNTGIQDAVNLGWKLALVTRGDAPESLLDSYAAERRPVGAAVLRLSDRAFAAVASPRPLVRMARVHLAPRLVPWALRVRVGRAAAFRTVSQLGIRYRDSPAVDTARAPRRGHRGPPRRPGRGPRAGDRLPDARVTRDGTEGWLHQHVIGAAVHLLLCGPADAWDRTALARLTTRFGGVLIVRHLQRTPAPGVLADPSGRVLARLRVRAHGQLLVRPDGHIAYRADHLDLTGVGADLTRLLLPRRCGAPG